MKILRVNAFDQGGGAERVARTLLNGERQAGHLSRLAVSRKLTQDPDVLEILPLPQPGRLAQALYEFYLRLKPPDKPPPGKSWVHYTSLRRGIKRILGIEIFDYPDTYRLFERVGYQPDILHLHNLHRHDGGFFDLRALPRFSQQVLTVMTLHDAWLLSGHCAHSFTCERWQTGCGHCPDLKIYPPIKRDATAYNWRAKRAIYQRSRLHIATPSRWLMERVEHSILQPAVTQSRVIHDGVDLSIFQPEREPGQARAALGLPQEMDILLAAAAGLRNNRFKDFPALHSAFERITDASRSRPVLLLALGEDGPPERYGDCELRFVRFESDPHRVARFYQAADLYVHAARADTFPNTVLEALACGTPVTATAVGGIPEQVSHGESGLLSPPGDAQALAENILQILGDPQQRQAMSQAAIRDASQRFDQRQMVASYLAWFEELREAGDSDIAQQDVQIRR